MTDGTEVTTINNNGGTTTVGPTDVVTGPVTVLSDNTVTTVNTVVVDTPAAGPSCCSVNGLPCTREQRNGFSGIIH